jgi:hypothetical protein
MADRSDPEPASNPAPPEAGRSQPATAAREPRTINWLPVEQLTFDIENPRLPPGTDRDFDSILAWMLSDGAILDLMGSIGAQSYFGGEPLLVVPDENGFTVVEGNRRLAAVYLLLHPERAATRPRAVAEVAREAIYKPTEVPVLEFEKRDDILNYLGYRHVTGIREWGPLEKARYVDQLIARMRKEGEEVDYKELARRIGSRTDYVRRLLDGLAVFRYAVDRRFYDLEGLDESSIDFSLLTTALGFNNLAAFVGLQPEDRADDYRTMHLDDDNLKDLFAWMYVERPTGGTVLGESRQIARLAKIVAEPNAVAALRIGEPLSVAASWTDEPAGQFRDSLRDARVRLERALQRAPQVREVTDGDFDVLAEIARITADIRTLLRSRLTDPDA